MAQFLDLHDMGQVLVELITEELGVTDVQVGAPKEAEGSTTAAARITLLYTTPQPTHRNDPMLRNPDGSLRHPPVTLSAFVLITTSGAADHDPIAAHGLLGRILQVFSANPILELPLSDSMGAGSPPGGYSDLGEGKLCVSQVPLQLDQLDKIWNSMAVKHQPFALFEVGPVQLSSLKPDLVPAPVVRPGGVSMEGPRSGARPVVRRLVPSLVRQGGRVRLVTQPVGTFEGLYVGGNWVAAGDGAVLLSNADGDIVLSLGAGALADLSEGATTLTLRSGGRLSERVTLTIADPDAPTLDASSVLTHNPSVDLEITGANLAGATEVVVWPDVGVASPSEVQTFAVSAAAAGAITVTGLGVLSLGTFRAGVAYRVAARVDDYVYTPYIVLEFGA